MIYWTNLTNLISFNLILLLHSLELHIAKAYCKKKRVKKEVTRPLL